MGFEKRFSRNQSMKMDKKNTWVEFVSRCHTDQAFARQAKKDPSGTLQEMGVKTPEGMEIQSHECCA